MRVASRLLTVVAAGCLGAIAGAQTLNGKDAASYLLRSFQRQFPVNVVAVLMERDPGSADSFQRVKVERSKDGQARFTILQPLRYQGYTIVDDGVRRKTYIPDKKHILDQESPAKEPCPAHEKILLAKKNYSFRFVSSPKIAGRETVCVVATPKFRDLEVRKYYLDEETSYPLRIETFHGNSGPNLILDTKDIQFPKTLDKRLFTLATLNDVKVERYSRPTKFVAGNQAHALVGFSPLIPQGLPLGFEVQEVQISSSDDLKSVVVRLSDGLARATVYQTKAGVPMKSPEDSTVVEHRGVRLMLISDLAPKVREQLLRSFISHALMEPGLRPQRMYSVVPTVKSGLRASLELDSTLWAFAGIDRPVAIRGLDVLTAPQTE